MPYQVPPVAAEVVVPGDPVVGNMYILVDEAIIAGEDLYEEDSF